MAVASTILAIAAVAAVGVSAYSMVQQQKAAKKSQRFAEKSAEEQRKINAENRAKEANAAAMERRKQYREERIRRAVIIQSAENTGVADSSGSLGAQGALASTLSSNVGFNVGEVSRGQRIGGMMDNISRFNTKSSGAMNTASMWGSIGNFSNSIFNSLGGFDAIGAGFKTE